MKTHEADRNRVPAQDCASMADVRREIDRVDRELVQLLAERLTYIERAGHIKAERGAVRDEDRIRDVLAKVKVDTTKAFQVMQTVFKLPENAIVPHPDRVHARNVINLFSEERFKGADLAGQTAWGLLNATTEYVDWHKRARNQNNRINSAWFGDGANLKDSTFNELMKVAA